MKKTIFAIAAAIFSASAFAGETTYLCGNVDSTLVTFKVNQERGLSDVAREDVYDIVYNGNILEPVGKVEFLGEDEEGYDYLKVELGKEYGAIKNFTLKTLRLFGSEIYLNGKNQVDYALKCRTWES